MSNCDHKNLMGYCMECDKAEIALLKAQLASPMLRCHKAGHQDEIDALKAEVVKLRAELANLNRPGFYCPACECPNCTSKGK